MCVFVWVCVCMCVMGGRSVLQYRFSEHIFLLVSFNHIWYTQDIWKHVCYQFGVKAINASKEIKNLNILNVLFFSYSSFDGRTFLQTCNIATTCYLEYMLILRNAIEWHRKDPYVQTTDIVTQTESMINPHCFKKWIYDCIWAMLTKISVSRR